MPTPNPDLGGLRVLVTRPAEQAAPLCQAIEAAGGVAIHYPTIEITSLPITGKIDPTTADLGIFISRNAVRYALKNFPHLVDSPLKTITVGRGSAEEYQKITGKAIDYTPHQHFNSEGVLALPELADIADKEIVLFKGEGGRDTLESELNKRGATVVPLELYRRTIPNSPSPIQRQAIDIIITTSNMALENLWEMTPESEQPILLNKPLIVVSERGEKLAEALGFHYHPLNARSAGTETLLESLREWQQANDHNHKGDPH